MRRTPRSSEKESPRRPQVRWLDPPDTHPNHLRGGGLVALGYRHPLTEDSMSSEDSMRPSIICPAFEVVFDPRKRCSCPEALQHRRAGGRPGGVSAAARARGAGCAQLVGLVWPFRTFRMSGHS